MNLIVGLGNPGNTYNFTRHNFGFLALDFYFKINQLTWEKTPKFNAIWKKSAQTIFLKPQTYYNETGRSVADFARYYKIPTQDILIVCDDFNLPFGTTRFRKNGSAGGNNGLKSCIKELGTEDFPRLRLGTGNDDLRKKLGDMDFVLSRFTTDEQAQLPSILKNISTRLTNSAM